MDKLCRRSLRRTVWSLVQGVWFQCAIQEINLKKHTSFVGSFDERPVHMFFSAPVFVVSLCQRTFHSSGSLKGGVVFFLSVSSMFT